MNQQNQKSASVEQKFEALLAQMTLEEKIGQMTQTRHFDDITLDDIKTKFIGSIIHTQGPTPGNNAAEWQAKFVQLQWLALSTRLGIPMFFGVDAVHGQNTYAGATIFPHNIGLGASRNPKLVEQAAGRIAVMPGAGINAENIQAIVSVTGANDFHFRGCLGSKCTKSRKVLSKSCSIVAFGGIPVRSMGRLIEQFCGCYFTAN